MPLKTNKEGMLVNNRSSPYSYENSLFFNLGHIWTNSWAGLGDTIRLEKIINNEDKGVNRNKEGAITLAEGRHGPSNWGRILTDFSHIARWKKRLNMRPQSAD